MSKTGSPQGPKDKVSASVLIQGIPYACFLVCKATKQNKLCMQNALNRMVLQGASPLPNLGFSHLVRELVAISEFRFRPKGNI